MQDCCFFGGGSPTHNPSSIVQANSYNSAQQCTADEEPQGQVSLDFQNSKGDKLHECKHVKQPAEYCCTRWGQHQRAYWCTQHHNWCHSCPTHQDSGGGSTSYKNHAH